jgi:hypothetical protein
MKFPNLMDMADYSKLLNSNGCSVLAVRNTERFLPCIEMYLNTLSRQLTYDALKIVGFDQEVMAALGKEMSFARDLAAAGKIIQGLFVARRA